jgi:regulator of cell morphogenesis and NO signaling
MNDRTLGDLVAAGPSAAGVLEDFGLDYCCRGDRTLDEACTASGIDATAVAAKLADLPGDHAAPWTALDAPALADHIVDVHHRYLHDELPRLDELAAKVLAVHGATHPALEHVQRLVAELRADLEPHLAKEERVLFPAIHDLPGGGAPSPSGRSPTRSA